LLRIASPLGKPLCITSPSYETDAPETFHAAISNPLGSGEPLIDINGDRWGNDHANVLTLSHHAKPHPMQENGMPIWAVVSTVVDGETMKVAQMLERSQTIKRGAPSALLTAMMFHRWTSGASDDFAVPVRP
jgi:hypothetical protein